MPFLIFYIFFLGFFEKNRKYRNKVPEKLLNLLTSIPPIIAMMLKILFFMYAQSYHNNISLLHVEVYRRKKLPKLTAILPLLEKLVSLPITPDAPVKRNAWHISKLQCPCHRSDARKVFRLDFLPHVHIHPASATLAIMPASVASNAPLRVQRVFVTFAAIK